MVSRLKNIFNQFQICYTITGSWRQSLRFILTGNGTGTFAIRFKNKKIYLRKKTTDKEVFFDTFYHGYHRSTVDIGASPVIIDMGSNIGLTIIDFAIQYPGATIIGVEADFDNYSICKNNISDLPNCTITHAAVWKADTQVYCGGKDAQSIFIQKNPDDTHFQKIRGVSINTLLTENSISQVDYLKMDIEGSEYPVLLDPSDKNWLNNVKFISVEVHDTPEISKEEGIKLLIEELEKNNFMVKKSKNHWSSFFAINKSFTSNGI